jgi:hypothetical protein
VLALLGVGAIVFLNRYYYLFADSSSQTGNETIDVTKVDIKNLDTRILKDKQFQSLQKMEAVSDNFNSLEKGKRNPFLPN